MGHHNVRGKGKKQSYKLHRTGLFQNKPEKDHCGTRDQKSNSGTDCGVLRVGSAVKGGCGCLLGVPAPKAGECTESSGCYQRQD